MELISWNLRGLNGTHKQDIVRNIIRDQRPNFWLIQETKMKKKTIGKLSFSSNMNGEATNSNGAAGGVLTLYNKKAYQLSTIFNEGNAFLCRVFHIYSNDSWFLLNIYAPNFKRDRRNFWDKILDTIQKNDINKGIIMGDFNTPLLDDKKLGGMAPNLDNKLDLSNFINSLAFKDMDLLGGRFTWSNRCIGVDCTQVYLDRVLISPVWLQSSLCRLSLLPRVGSNHSPISLSINPLMVR